MFNYASKEILSIKKDEKKITEEVERVKGLSDGKTVCLAVSSCASNSLFYEDCISEMKGVKKQKGS